MRLTSYERHHPAYRRRLERCIRQVKIAKVGLSRRNRKVNPWAVCRATVKRR